MADDRILDIAHISFLDMIQALVTQSGIGSTKGTLIRIAKTAADHFDTEQYATMDDFVEAVKREKSPFVPVEGPSVHIGNGTFGLPKCPFTQSIANYKRLYGQLPNSYTELTKEFNRASPATDKYRIGEGSGVSPFCAVHQTLRSALGERMTIGGNPALIYQLGCKSGAGVKGLADKWIQESGSSADTVSKTLDDHVCCYAIRTAA